VTYTINVTRDTAPSGGITGGYTTPANVTVTGTTGSNGQVTAPITASQTNLINNATTCNDYYVLFAEFPIIAIKEHSL
jgi:hypothetical protein